MDADARLTQAAADLGHSFDAELREGGNYVPLVRHDHVVYVSGQMPRVGDTVVVTGCVGDDVSLDQAQHAARVCAMRALVLLQRALSSLDEVRQVLRVTVYVQSAAQFTQHGDVANAASELLHRVLNRAGTHTRTLIGVFQLPKNASVELDLIASVRR